MGGSNVWPLVRLVCAEKQCLHTTSHIPSDENGAVYYDKNISLSSCSQSGLVDAFNACMQPQVCRPVISQQNFDFLGCTCCSLDHSKGRLYIELCGIRWKWATWDFVDCCRSDSTWSRDGSFRCMSWYGHGSDRNRVTMGIQPLG